jgi:NAD(P)-dependent dehydrogenase (short-subunit alcohol dehydrogenase family)
LARDHAVAVIARSAAELDETVRLVQRAGGCAQAFVADATDRQAVDHAFSAIERGLGPVDLLVNNAGVVVSLRVPKL